MSRQFPIPRVGLLVLAAALGAGCGPPKVPLAPVKGKVTVDGQEVTSGNVAFQPADPNNKAGTPAAKIQSDGSYELYTGGAKGAPLGSYKVTVTPSMEMTPGSPGRPTGAFNSKYTDANTSGLKFEVIDKPEDGRYDLKLTK
jgi:hypothetical protein